MAKITAVIVHHSASRSGTLRAIDEWHRARGWKMVGYHVVIGNGHPFSSRQYLPAYDGLLELGRPHNFDSTVDAHEQGAHTLGMNAESLGVCLIGEKYADYSAAQLRALVDWLRVVHGALKLNEGMEVAVKGHKEIDRKKPVDPDIHMGRLRRLVSGGVDHRIFTDRQLKEHLRP